ncbi:Fur-regulated basic protein FbpA [Bacillus chungangensis]|uniref:Fur-regulated basic protein FbpA n=1 Tax=Bacillus chungangensis TaxID=587633 RepID=A0ABT9WS24_9BACI|nr:Fur-regulated basic protein FbpA [Bacillus chungangensis]MDQ0176022.1 hypothetical protein [Bacillus chungangensis]
MALLRGYVELSQESKKQVLLQELEMKGVYEARDGRHLDDLSYYELRNELVMREVIEQG